MTTNGKRIYDLIHNQDPCMVPVYQDDSNFPPTLIISKEGQSNYLRAIVFGADSSSNMDILEIPPDFDFSDDPKDETSFSQSKFIQSEDSHSCSEVLNPCSDIVPNKHLVYTGPAFSNKNVGLRPVEGGTPGNSGVCNNTHLNIPKQSQSIFIKDQHPQPQGEKSSMLRHLLDPLPMSYVDHNALQQHFNALPRHHNTLQQDHNALQQLNMRDMDTMKTVTSFPEENNGSSIGIHHDEIPAINAAETNTIEDNTITVSDPPACNNRKENMTRRCNYRPLSQLERQQRYKECMLSTNRKTYLKKLQSFSQEIETNTSD
ncbi:uncharacterized protein [Antedon mediterranea]|uniref:uncharacterized protein n=1 Tax=Antedon mediterranea TaxID=105859 RepID=UPI003AF86045